MNQIDEEYLSQIIAAAVAKNNCASRIVLRPARGNKKYFEIRPASVVYCEPHKYNIRVHGQVPPCDDITFELNVATKNGSTHIPFGLIVDKQVHVKGAPTNSFEVRALFSVDSRQYQNSVFEIVAKNEFGDTLCKTKTFYLQKKMYQ